MTPKEAYNTLEVSENISDEDLKKHWKQLSKTYHPDLYKGDDRDTKLKEINAAYQVIKEYRESPQKFQQEGMNIDINIQDILFNFGRNANQSRPHNYSPIHLNLTIDFKQSVIGVSKEIEFDRFTKCDTCNGKGLKFESNGCAHCNGFGRVVVNEGGFHYSSTCQKCYGRNIKNSKCEKCNSNGVINTHTNITIHIPPGTLNNSVLSIRGIGHFNGNAMFGDAHTNVFVQINVIEDKDLKLDGQDVVSELNISLLDALVGCNKEVKTINGQSEIIIPKLSKNKDEVKIKGCGVPINGMQRVILNVLYPTDITELVKLLTKEQNASAN